MFFFIAAAASTSSILNECLDDFEWIFSRYFWLFFESFLTLYLCTPKYARSCCQQGNFTEGLKTCFAHISFKSALYKNRSVCKLYVPGGTVTRFWVFLDTIEHTYLVSGPFLHIHLLFVAAFFGPFDHLLHHAEPHRRHQDLIATLPSTPRTYTLYILHTYYITILYAPLSTDRRTVARRKAPSVGGGPKSEKKTKKKYFLG